MKKEMLERLTNRFERIVQIEEDTGLEFWYARDLQNVLGYKQWKNFQNVIEKAISACDTFGADSEDHFVSGIRTISLGGNAERDISDIALTRYACYLIAQNGDSTKKEIAFAQTYFAVQTRKMETIERRYAELERILARKKLTNSEKKLSGKIYESVKDSRSFARIRSRGDAALFGGKTTRDMKHELRVPNNRPLADFLPTITIKAKDFANEITIFNMEKDNLLNERDITVEHVTNNEDVRKVLEKRGIQPEELPPAEDAKKVERRLKKEEKNLLEEQEKSYQSIQEQKKKPKRGRK